MSQATKWTDEGWEPLSEDEVARLQEILDLGLLDDQADPRLDEIVRQAAERFGVPVSLVSIVLDGAQCFAASYGLQGWVAEAQGTPVEYSFCVFAVRSRDVFVVEDATAHPLVRSNPVVTFDGIRSYAGVPLITSRGQALGTLCVVGSEPRKFSSEDLDDLRGLGQRVVDLLESRRADR
jgi:GAF domain-containing protein